MFQVSRVFPIQLCYLQSCCRDGHWCATLDLITRMHTGSVDLGKEDYLTLGWWRVSHNSWLLWVWRHFGNSFQSFMKSYFSAPLNNWRYAGRDFLMLDLLSREPCLTYMWEMSGLRAQCKDFLNTVLETGTPESLWNLSFDYTVDNIKATVMSQQTSER